MNGRLLWFNDLKDLGAIRADDGSRVEVHRSGFAPGHVPVGRCAGTEVSFTVREAGGEPRAVDVEVVPVIAPRRARRRHRSSGW